MSTFLHHFHAVLQRDRDVKHMLQSAGIHHVRTRTFLFGSAVVLWGVKAR